MNAIAKSNRRGLWLCVIAAHAAEGPYDLVLRNARIVDGTEAVVPRRPRDARRHDRSNCAFYQRVG